MVLHRGASTSLLYKEIAEGKATLLSRPGAAYDGAEGEATRCKKISSARPCLGIRDVACF